MINRIVFIEYQKQKLIPQKSIFITSSTKTSENTLGRYIII